MSILPESNPFANVVAAADPLATGFVDPLAASVMAGLSGEALSADEWVLALGLRMTGAQSWNGPCVLCGGDDRFHVSVGVGGRALVGCRRCSDGRPVEERRVRYGEFVKAARLRLAGREVAVSPAPAPPAPPRRYVSPAGIWSAARRHGVVSGHPLRRYLVSRAVLSDGDDLPLSVAWLTSAVGGRLEGVVMPAVAVGAVVWRYVDAAGDVSAVGLEALDGDGKRLVERWRRHFGTKRGAGFVVGDVGASDAVVVEGEVSALAALRLFPRSRVIAVGGDGGLPRLDVGLLGVARRVIVLPDNDAGSVEASKSLVSRLRFIGYDALVSYSFVTSEAKSDVADYLLSVAVAGVDDECGF